MCLSQVTLLWGSKYSLNGFYLAVYRSLGLSIEHIVYTQCLGHPMCSNVEDFTFFSFISPFSSFLPCFLSILWVNSCHKKNHIVHLREALSLDPTCALKAKLFVPMHFDALFCPAKLLGSAGNGFFHMKNCTPGICLIHFCCKWALHSLYRSQLELSKVKNAERNKTWLPCLALQICSY